MNHSARPSRRCADPGVDAAGAKKLGAPPESVNARSPAMLAARPFHGLFRAPQRSPTTETRMGSLSLEHASLTHRGRVRSRNEDALRADAERGLFIVADGMGGHPAGDVASAEAIEGFAARCRVPGSDDGGGAGVAAAGLHDAVAAASRQVHEAAAESPDRRGMGTTLTALQIAGDRWRIAHVGDTRAYLYRAGELRRLTTDHTVFPGSSTLTRAVGTEGGTEPDLEEGPVEDGDLYLLCSDGLTKTHSEEEIADRLAAVDGGTSAPGATLDETVRRLVEEANERGGPDNVTVVLVRARREDRGGAGGDPQP